MQSPSIEWTLLIGNLALLDYLRARGEADSDTLSEVIRGYVDSHPAGRAIFTATLAAGAIGFHRHICRT